MRIIGTDLELALLGLRLRVCVSVEDERDGARANGGPPIVTTANPIGRDGPKLKARP